MNDFARLCIFLKIFLQEHSYLWIGLMYRSSFFPGVKFGPMIRTFRPVDTQPENTRPKA